MEPMAPERGATKAVSPVAHSTDLNPLRISACEKLKYILLKAMYSKNLITLVTDKSLHTHLITLYS
jgi:hypothetical protein